MEKGNQRSSSASKSNSETQAKNKQDVTNKYLRLPRFRESISPRTETRRKPNPQKSRELFDKRPRNKTGAVYERYRSEIDVDVLDEPHNKQGCKKMNLNHLLNFTLAPMDNRDVQNGRRGIYNRKIKFPKYNKELFLQANCQFVARDYGNFLVHQKNPDLLVEWPLIEEIRLPSHEVPLCPICLYIPVAAKITKCGHIYCWPCILHYLSLTDRTWQKCPICFEAVHKNELKSVSVTIRKPFVIGDEIVMCLMKRAKDSLLPLPVTHESPKHFICNIKDDDLLTRYQKLLLANREDIKAIINREFVELKEAYEKEKDAPEACFIESALKLLEERENNLDGQIFNNCGTEKHIDEVTNLNNAVARKHLESLSSTDSHDEIFQIDMTEHSEISNEIPLNLNQNPEPLLDSDKKGNCFFYQAEDGQHLYLHNINVRMLLKEYGSLEFAPPIIKAKIVEIERVSMTEVLRKRLRYLHHLPLTCEFQIVELNFFHLLSKPVILQFKSEINKRKHLRSKKASDERRREKFIEQEENKKLGKYPKATYNLKSADQFPVYDPNDFQSLSPPKSDSSANQNVDENVMNTYFENNNDNASSPVNSFSETSSMASFAQMLKDGPKTFSKIFEKNKESPPPTIPPQQNNDSDADEYVPAPEYHQSFSDAIQAALDSVSIQDSSDKNQKQSKKKKGKKQLLFTTSMCRNK
ncbi:RING finger protein 10-like [Uloborus diversus]|uniref:RING finger protein 10-like n=1 Tax=Uloborus diversus TaxID=327109 RepID=UPI00240A0EE5|nr:RING finger protein 10-like [Uloborus diversus]